MTQMKFSATESGTTSVTELIEQACAAIAPSWPLDRMIAVNPYWPHKEQNFASAAVHLARQAGSPMHMPKNYYRELWQQGKIRLNHLQQALDEDSTEQTPDSLIKALTGAEEALKAAPLLCDALDARRDLRREPSWCDTITHQISQFCAAWFDQGQADWSVPHEGKGLYADWLQTMRRDHSVALLMKMPDLTVRVAALPEHYAELIEHCLSDSAIAVSEWGDYLEAVLLRINGWASWCAYRQWQAAFSDGADDTLKELLAIRLAWERLIDDGVRAPGSAWARWRQSWQQHQAQSTMTRFGSGQIWQRAHELAYQSGLLETLAQDTPDAAPDPDVQAVFCIDVRSEIFRRCFERQSERIQTLGFAGFFGLPVSYQPIGSEADRPQLPGLLAPVLAVTDSSGHAETDDRLIRKRQQRFTTARSQQAFHSAPASAFSMVEMLGLGYAGKLIRKTLGADRQRPGVDGLGLTKHERQQLRPDLSKAMVSPEARIDLAESVLRGMNLLEKQAPLVLLLGHGSQTVNNPQRAGLDCGACCGQTGEVNARTLAALLNDGDVREGLKARDIHINASTWFVAGLHNTTTDEIELFDTKQIPESQHNRLTHVREQLAQAGDLARRERAPKVGLSTVPEDTGALLQSLQQRASDWSQTRPEWGLANNAAFVIAPRHRTRGLNLEGRSFLHDYDPVSDPEGTLLTQIMTAPMVVTNWINLQYFASTVDNPRYGSGNKTLHNVVGADIGVFEGNGGDLRTGLAMQSVHNGESWMHEPLRLTVVIDAPAARIEKIIAEQAVVRDLVENRWLYLARFHGKNVEIRPVGGWPASGD